MKSIKVTDVENTKSYTFLNDVEDGCVINAIKGFEYPQSIVIVEDIASDDGAIAISSKFGRRVCSFIANLNADILNQRHLILDALRQTSYLKKIEFTTLDDIALQFYAYVTKFSGDYKTYANQLLVELTAPDFRFYSQTETSVEIAANGSENCENTGNENTNPTITIDGPAATVNMSDSTTGFEFDIVEAIADGEQLVIDMKEKTVKLDGVDSFSMFDGDFFKLEPGDNSIDFVTTGGDAGTKATIKYRNAYNGA